MNRKILILLIIALILPFLIFAEQDELFQTRGQANSGASFINSTYNAYGISTGGILTIFGNDGNAIFWNPAGLSEIQNTQLQLSTGVLNYDKLVSYINFSKPFGEDGNNAIGITGLNSYVGKISSYDANDNYLKKLEYMGNALIITYARPVSIVRFGINVKILNEIIDKTKSYGGSMDLGLIITPPLPIYLGIALNNFPGLVKWEGEKRTHQVGSSYRIGLGYKDVMNKIKFGIVFNKEYGDDVSTDLGGEIALASFMALRLGLYNGNFAGGFGFNLGPMDISYAFYQERFLELDTLSHLLSLTFNF